MRGALEFDKHLQIGNGIIPACAGSTASVQPTPSLDWDHPRLCGEHGHLDPGNVQSLGSSPLVRGAPPNDEAEDDMSGIIPACAGSTIQLPG